MKLDRKFSTAIIGMGPHGKRIQEAASGIAELEIVALIDSKPAAFESLNVDHEIIYSDFDKALEQNQIDVLLIATNGPSHAALVSKAIRSGIKKIMVEKPMACSVMECLEMEELAKANGVRLSVDKINRHDPVYQLIKEGIEGGDWGQLRSIYIQKPGIGLGCLGTHSFDLASFLSGSEALNVSGWIDEAKSKNPRGDQFVDPGGTVIVQFPNQVRALIEQIEDGAGPQTLEVHLTGARIYHDPKNEILDIRIRDLNIKPGPGRPPVYTKLPLPSELNIKGNMIAQIKSVLTELIGAESMLTEAKYGRHAMEILVAAYMSDKNGHKPIELPLTDTSHIEFYLPIT